jgi:hypothetical protein
MPNTTFNTAGSQLPVMSSSAPKEIKQTRKSFIEKAHRLEDKERPWLVRIRAEGLISALEELDGQLRAVGVLLYNFYHTANFVTGQEAFYHIEGSLNWMDWQGSDAWPTWAYQSRRLAKSADSTRKIFWGAFEQRAVSKMVWNSQL